MGDLNQNITQIHTRQELKELQSLPLDLKVRLTKQRIREWVGRYGTDGVYVSFSGGKDSTVLLDIVREMYGDIIPGVFCDTGLEYPEIRDFVREKENIVLLKPKKNFRKVIEDYGYPFISKEVSGKVYDCHVSERGGRESYARRQFNGTYVSKNGNKNLISVKKWRFLLDSPYDFSNKCCDVMKKSIAKSYEKKTGRHPMLGQLAEESELRKKEWLTHSCNAFDKKRPTSNPMSFWTEQDVLLYIYKNKIPIASVYGEVVKDVEVKGQYDFADLGIFELERHTLKTTGCNRTGCVYCGYGCHLDPEGEGRFEKLKITHPKIYDYIMRPWDEGGLDYKNVIDWLNEHGGLNIRY